MAKKRTTKKSSKKTKNKLHNIVSFVKHTLIGIAVAFALLIGVMYASDLLSPSMKEEVKKQAEEIKEQATPLISQNKQIKKLADSSQKLMKEISSLETSSKSVKIPAKMEIPQLKAKRKEQIIEHEGYTVSYNSDYRIANWVAYQLTEAEVENRQVERSNKFVSDPDVKGATAMNEDYTRSGYDRGHLAPAGDMRWSMKAMYESFYLSNICPQNTDLNRGVWNDLEIQCRMWAKDNGSILIVTGPVITEDMKHIGKNRVAVPKAFYKVICYHTGKEYKGIGFIFENRNYKGKLDKRMAVSIDSVEEVTGIDFFPSIPDSAEDFMEKAVDWDSWSF
ncbi:MAG: DNA/RNA non-specific endonuclease [Parabacteroides sp.]|nr:DNA/RNA non-specific endonuclease [Parabacteroides sp.]